MPKGKKGSTSSSRSKQTKRYKVHRQGGSYYSSKSPRKKSQKYYPTSSQAKQNRCSSAKVAVRMRKKRGTQWRHGRKSKSQVKRK